jgi:hypothetical protein
MNNNANTTAGTETNNAAPVRVWDAFRRLRGGRELLGTVRANEAGAAALAASTKFEVPVKMISVVSRSIVTRVM